MSSRPKHLYEFGPFVLDPAERTLLREGRRVRLRPKVFDMLLVLVENSGRLVAKEELMRAVWPDQFVEEGNLNKNVSMLREVLGESPATPVYIETEPKRGYRFVADVRSVKGDEAEFVLQTRIRASLVVEEEETDEVAAIPVGAVHPHEAVVVKSSAELGPVSTPLTGNFSQRQLKGQHRHVRTWVVTAVAVGIIVVVALVAFLFRNRSKTDETPTISRVVQITSWAGLDFYPTISRDGNTIAFSSDRTGSFEIYVKQMAEGANEVQLTADGGQNFEPAFSPRGDSIAYYSKKRGGIWVIPIIGGKPRQLTEFGSHPAWSPDGSQIAFQSASVAEIGFNAANAQPPSTIWVVSEEGGEPRQITQSGNPVDGHGAPSWSPDGKRIVFDVSNYGAYSVWSVTLQGLAVTKISGKLHAVDPVYAADGKSIYFVNVRDNCLERVNVSRTGEPIGDPIKIFDSSGSRMRQISSAANGKRIMYAALSTSSDVWSQVLSPNGADTNEQPVELTHGRNTRNTGPAFSPDGKRIAYTIYPTAANFQIWVMDADGNHKNQLAENGAHAWWFRDGSRIAYSGWPISNFPNYWSVTVEGGKKKKLFDYNGEVGFARLSPDGQQIALHSNRSGTRNVWLTTIEGGAPKQLTFDRESAAFPIWSPDGKWLAFQVDHSNESYIAVIPSTGGEPIRLTTDKGPQFVYDWSPDSDKVLYAGQRDGIWNVYWVSRSTKQQKQLTHFDRLNSYVRYPAWSPLNDRIAYEYAETTGNIWMLELK